MSDAYGVLFREILHPTWESGVRRRPTLAHLRELDRSQWLSHDELIELQSRSLGRLLRHAQANVPYYRRAFERAGVDAGDVKNVEDLQKLPLLTREAARETLSDRSSTRAPFPEVHKMTSGTSGTPLAFAYDRDSDHWRNAVKLRGYGWAHYQPGDRSVHFWGSLAAFHPIPAAKRAKIAVDHLLRREHFVDCTDRSEQALARVVHLLQEVRPSVLVCYSQAGAALARYVLESKSQVEPGMSVICAAERLYPADREMMVRAFGPHVFETYGSREVMLIAAECDAHQGLHTSMENLVVELLVRDEHGTRPAAPGEPGEVVLTDLHNFGAPFIRYVTGDVATALPPGRCACGRGLDRLASVEGRVTDTLRDARGRPVSGLLFNVLFSVMADRVREFQVIQRRDGSIDLGLVPAQGFDQSVLERVREGAGKFLPGVELRVAVVPEIAADQSGKRRVVKVET
ncbi:MAG: phenylacetate--CoA ligase family protein [Myxococcales bacterium]|nr:phenylacetate--CoA ligase family protein [Myxococcales bacterium]